MPIYKIFFINFSRTYFSKIKLDFKNSTTCIGVLYNDWQDKIFVTGQDKVLLQPKLSKKVLSQQGE
jgi:hypothetical protein